MLMLDFYFALIRERSVCRHAYLKKRMSKVRQIFYACCLWPITVANAIARSSSASAVLWMTPCFHDTIAACRYNISVINCSVMHRLTPRGVDPYGTGGTVDTNIYEGGTSMVMSPNILEVMSFRM